MTTTCRNRRKAARCTEAGKARAPRPAGGVHAAAATAQGRDTDTYSPVVAGMVLRAARLSASASVAALARAAGVSAATIRSWESGFRQIASASLPEIEELEAALTRLGAEAEVLADLEPGIWCDLVLAAITGHEDIGCLMSDPATADVAFAELLTWATCGLVPTRYQPYAAPGLPFIWRQR